MHHKEVVNNDTQAFAFKTPTYADLLAQRNSFPHSSSFSCSPPELQLIPVPPPAFWQKGSLINEYSLCLAQDLVLPLLLCGEEALTLSRFSLFGPNKKLPCSSQICAAEAKNCLLRKKLLQICSYAQGPQKKTECPNLILIIGVLPIVSQRQNCVSFVGECLRMHEHLNPLSRKLQTSPHARVLHRLRSLRNGASRTPLVHRANCAWRSTHLAVATLAGLLSKSSAAPASLY